MITEKIIALIMVWVLSIPGFASEAFIKENPQTDSNIKNVIYVIGDGMGMNHLKKAEKDLNLDLVMDEMPIQGWSMTSSVSGITDSAAGGTALSCGIKTINSYVGVYSYDPLRVRNTPRSITEICNSHGMRTGVISTDKLTGATPAAFTVHTNSRDNSKDILNQQAVSDFDLIWAGKADTDEALLKSNGFTVVKKKSEMMSLKNGQKSYGMFTGRMWSPDVNDPDYESYSKNTPPLSLMTKKAIEVLDGSKEGFFLMVEAAHIDKYSHEWNGDDMVKAVEELNNTMKVVLDFAKKDGKTLVVLTADHETGGIKNIFNDYRFTMYNLHTNANVPVFVYGSDKLIKNGETVQNVFIPRKIVAILGFDTEEFKNAA